MNKGKYRFSSRSVRNLDEQRYYVRTGKSKTMKSRHLGGFALDFVAWVDGKVSYKREHMKRVADAFKLAGDEILGPGRIEWGGDWKKFIDQPHIQLSSRYYPDV